ncbi:hypothetical protein P8605_30735 [Streptomyces sp. T-3]|nr:hypothetical protein [Streptomyces sp. T-3]
MSATTMARSIWHMAFGPSALKRCAAPLSAHQRWNVSLGAILDQRSSGRSHLRLYPLKRVNPHLVP